MSTCKECYHYKACEKSAETFGYICDDVTACESCDFFLDRSRVVVLPCKVGDTVYRIRKYFNDATLKHGKEVIASTVDYICIEKTVCNDFYSLEMGGLFYNNSPIGKTVFLTREEAEVALFAPKEPAHV